MKSADPVSVREQGTWYLDRIGDLLKHLQRESPHDSDDAELCQAMLRELLARAHSDSRAARQVCVSMSELACCWAMAESMGSLKINARMRPSTRWISELNGLRAKVISCLSAYENRRHLPLERDRKAL